MPLSVSDGLSAWIKDFMKSDAPQFKGKTKEEIVKMAIAAYTDAGGKLKEDKMKFKDIREKFKVQTFKGHPRITDIYVQFRGGKGDRITSPENRRDFTSAVKMTLQFLKKNKLKSKPVFSTPEEGSSAYKVSLILNKQEEKTADLSPLAHALAVLRTAEDHGMAWAKPVGEVKEFKDPTKYFPRDREWKQLMRKHKRHIKALQDKGKDLPSNAEEEIIAWAMDNGEIKTSDDIESFIDDYLLNAHTEYEGKSLNEKAYTKDEKLVQQAVGIALQMGGNMTGAYKKIEKLKRGLGNHPVIKAALKIANEEVTDAI